MQLINKPWGFEEHLVIGKSIVMKRITINAGHRMSLQYHKIKEECLIVLSGTLICWWSQERLDVESFLPGQVVHIPKEKVHRFGASDAGNVVLIECSTTELHDVVRLADDYSRN